MSLLNIESFKKWLYKPKKGDNSLLAQFYYADIELNQIASELDSFDGRKDPERCTSLVSQLRKSQDKVLGICNRIMDEAIPRERVNREFRAKFPDDILTDSLAGELWFGAECLAAGSTIVNREVESISLRPLAKAVTRSLDHVRCLLRLQCTKLQNSFPERTKEALKIFDRLFADFELSYVSVLVPVKSLKEYHMQQDVIVLMSETLSRAMKSNLVSQEMVDDCDPVLMFTIPRLAIVYGLLYYPDGALNIDVYSSDISELFRPFQSLLHKIRNLLKTLSRHELQILEKDLCSLEEPSSNDHQEVKAPVSNFASDAYIKKFYTNNSTSKQFITDFFSHNFGTSPPTCTLSNLNGQGSRQHTAADVLLNSSPMSTSSSFSLNEDNDMLARMRKSGRCHADDEDMSSSSGSSSYGSIDSNSVLNQLSNANSECLNCNGNRQRHQSDSSASSSSDFSSTFPRRFSESSSPNCNQQNNGRVSSRNSAHSLLLEQAPTEDLNSQTTYSDNNINNNDKQSRKESVASSCSTISINTGCQDDEEIAFAIQAAEIASHHQIRSRFTNSRDLIHRLFVCISGVADQLQTNFASDLRNILKCVFNINSSDCSVQEITFNHGTSISTYVENIRSSDLSLGHSFESQVDSIDGSQLDLPIEDGEDVLVQIDKLVEVSESRGEKPPVWVPDNESIACTECSAPFNIVRRRHHCRNCGKIFCYKCSSHWIPIPHYGLKQPVRVCNPCFTFQTVQITQT